MCHERDIFPWTGVIGLAEGASFDEIREDSEATKAALQIDKNLNDHFLDNAVVDATSSEKRVKQWGRVKVLSKEGAYFTVKVRGDARFYFGAKKLGAKIDDMDKKPGAEIGDTDKKLGAETGNTQITPGDFKKLGQKGGKKLSRGDLLFFYRNRGIIHTAIAAGEGD